MHGHGVFRRQHAHRQGGINAAERRNARREDDASLAKEPHDIRKRQLDEIQVHILFAVVLDDGVVRVVEPT